MVLKPPRPQTPTQKIEARLPSGTQLRSSRCSTTPLHSRPAPRQVKKIINIIIIAVGHAFAKRSPRQGLRTKVSAQGLRTRSPHEVSARSPHKGLRTVSAQRSPHKVSAQGLRTKVSARSPHKGLRTKV